MRSKNRYNTFGNNQTTVDTGTYQELSMYTTMAPVHAR